MNTTETVETMKIHPQPRGLLVAVFVLLLFASPTLMAQLDSPAPPDDPASASYTLEDLYNRLAAGAGGVLRGSGFGEPTTGPMSSGRSLNEIMGRAPLADDASGLQAAQCVAGQTYWSLLTASWGPRECTAPSVGQENITPGPVAQGISAGFHDGTGSVAGDPNLVAGNIATGVQIFGVDGSASLASGAATDDQVLAGVTYSNAGGASTGTMPNVGARLILPGRIPRTIPKGFHNGSGMVIGDSDLVPENIPSGVVLFGVAGRVHGGCDCFTPDVVNGKRWCDHRDGTVTDLSTCLVWLRDAGCVEFAPWTEPASGSPAGAHTRASQLFDGSTAFPLSITGGDCSLSDGSLQGDWRLPTAGELRALTSGAEAVSSSTPRAFTGVRTSFYWSSTSHAVASSLGSQVSLIDGSLVISAKNELGRVWPVRSGQ